MYVNYLNHFIYKSLFLPHSLSLYFSLSLALSLSLLPSLSLSHSHLPPGDVGSLEDAGSRGCKKGDTPQRTVSS